MMGDKNRDGAIALKALRAEIAFLKAEAVVSTKMLEIMQQRLERQNGGPCAKDGQPCFVGTSGDEHYRCGTVQCGMKKAAPPPNHPNNGPFPVSGL